MKKPDTIISSAHRDEPYPYKQKAGVFIFGMHEGKMHVVAPWAEGNFSNDGRKAYLLPKGTVDEVDGELEDVKKAAIREVAEETGIYLDEVEGDPRPEDKRRYVFDPTNEHHVAWKQEGRDCFYEGVQVKHWLNQGEQVVNGWAPTNRGNPAMHYLYAIEVEGIKNLDKDDILKHGTNGTNKPLVTLKAKEVAQGKVQLGELPDFETLLETLRTGFWKWGEDASRHGWLFDPVFEMEEKRFLRDAADSEFAQHYACLKEQGNADLSQVDTLVTAWLERHRDIDEGKEKITKHDQLDMLFQSTAVQNVLKDHLKLMRKHLEGKSEDVGIEWEPLINDQTGLKVDSKQHPLHYYQEGADIIPAQDYLERMAKFATIPEHKMYRNSQFSPRLDDRKVGRVHVKDHNSMADLALKVVSQAVEGHEFNSKTIEQQFENVAQLRQQGASLAA